MNAHPKARPRGDGRGVRGREQVERVGGPIHGHEEPAVLGIFLQHFEAQNGAVEAARSLEVGHPEQHMPNSLELTSSFRGVGCVAAWRSGAWAARRMFFEQHHRNLLHLHRFPPRVTGV